MSVIAIDKIPLPDDRYYKQIFPKKQIWVHHTAGRGNGQSVINDWATRTVNQKIGTAFVITQDGTISQCFDDKYYANHIGIKASDPGGVNNFVLQKQSIGIEMVSWGPLTQKGGKFFSYVNVEVLSSNVQTYTDAFKGSRFYEKYTTAQLNSLQQLLCALTDKYNIPKVGVDNAAEFDILSDAINDVSGIYTHVNGRADKSDCHPQPELIQLVQNLNVCSGLYTVPNFDTSPTKSLAQQAASPVTPIAGTVTKDNKATSTDGDSPGGGKGLDMEPAGHDAGVDLSATFRQIERNVNNIELGDTEATWGKRSNPSEDSDWIGLKQFLLYLASRYSPQSLFPFVELIPVLTVQEETIPAAFKDLNSKGYVSDGNIPKETLDTFVSSIPITSLRDKAKDRLKFITNLPPGFKEERFNLGARTTNNTSGISDLFSLDPFKEGLESIDKLSKSGEAIKKERNIGVRAYGQLVFSPAPVADVPSKPGAIGFTEVEVQAGTQSTNGLALINLKLTDVQGNKFVDINSPWSFIYDARPGSAGGDFYFRYGWQIRVPDPNDKTDLLSFGFWNHIGWDIFGEDVKNDIKQQIIPGKQLITLTQSLNVNESAENKTDNSAITAIFDEGIEFNEVDGTVQVSRKALNDQNYVRLSILNPEITIDERGAITASLSFMTTGAIAKTIPLEYAKTTKAAVAKNQIKTLGDLLIAVIDDSNKYSFITTQNPEAKAKQQASLGEAYNLSQTRNFENLVFIIGPEEGGNTGSIHPDTIDIKISSKYAKQVTNPTKESGLTLIRWMRQVLQDNDCELQSAATGSGAGINASWIIVTTQKIDQKKNKSMRKLSSTNEQSQSRRFIDFILHEKDVFSYRFQGSLVEKLGIEKTEAPNAMKIAVDYDVARLPSFESETGGGADAELNKPVTAADRQRNLLAVFSQMQNCNIDCLAHPWIGPGKKIFVKGMGFYDGEYVCLQVTHKLIGHKFTTNIQGARILAQNNTDKQDVNDQKAFSKASGKGNMATEVNKQETKGAISTSKKVQALEQAKNKKRIQ